MVSFIHLCREIFPPECMPAENFINNSPYPPLDFPENSLDLITAYSVFSHLSENAANLWINEFYRILKPGGLLAITLRMSDYLKYIDSLKSAPLSAYNMREINLFTDPEVIRRHEKGEFIWFTHGNQEQLTEDFYGDCVIPLTYIQENWLDKYILRFFEDYNSTTKVHQAFMILEKK